MFLNARLAGFDSLVSLSSGGARPSAPILSALLDAGAHAWAEEGEPTPFHKARCFLGGKKKKKKENDAAAVWMSRPPTPPQWAYYGIGDPNVLRLLLKCRPPPPDELLGAD